MNNFGCRIGVLSLEFSPAISISFLTCSLKENIVAQGIILLIGSKKTFLILERNHCLFEHLTYAHDKIEIADFTEDRPNRPR